MPSFSHEPSPRSPAEPNQELASQQQQLRIAGLIEGLKDADSYVRCDAARALGKIGPEARDAVPALVNTLKDPNFDVRYLAACVLGNIGPDAVPALAAALKDSNWNVGYQAARALGRIGPKAQGAVPALAKALKNPDENVRRVAAQALKAIEPAKVLEKEIATEKIDDATPQPPPGDSKLRLAVGEFVGAAMAMGVCIGGTAIGCVVGGICFGPPGAIFGGAVGFGAVLYRLMTDEPRGDKSTPGKSEFS